MLSTSARKTSSTPRDAADEPTPAAPSGSSVKGGRSPSRSDARRAPLGGHGDRGNDRRLGGGGVAARGATPAGRPWAATATVGTIGGSEGWPGVSGLLDSTRDRPWGAEMLTHLVGAAGCAQDT